jgi:Rrf2 family protein
MPHANVQFSVAAHLLAVMAYNDGQELTSGFLAESVNADPTFVRRTLAKLSKAGLVTATRGRNGSCILARSPERISLLDIYRASEAPPAFVVHTYPITLSCPVSCNIKGSMADVLESAQAGLEKSLSQQTLADFTNSIKAAESSPRSDRKTRLPEIGA